MNLKDYVAKFNVSVPRLARQVKITPRALYAILDMNVDIRLSVAMRIENATEGRVKCLELITEDIMRGERVQEHAESCA